MDKKITILILDSGIGGLSIYKEIYQLLPNLHYIYAFDNAGFPYGDKPDNIVEQRVKGLIEKIAQQYPIDIVVIACNTASTICLPVLREYFQFPIVGVVPAIKPAVELSQNKHIGLLATKATINRSYTRDLIEQFASDCRVELLGISELAIMAENKLHGKPVDISRLTQLMAPWLTLSLSNSLDTIVLGCTHYPFIKNELKLLFPNVTFIDSGEAIAKRVAFLLEKNRDIRSEITSSATNQIISTSFDDNIETMIFSLFEQNLFNYQTIMI
ncbi:MAG: glutamate racemase [Candidatus Schmidhempelia sp.]|nr:glutamate racemase [Candidatus Schmidhempelia sp.]